METKQNSENSTLSVTLNFSRISNPCYTEGKKELAKFYWGKRIRFSLIRENESIIKETKLQYNSLCEYQVLSISYECAVCISISLTNGSINSISWEAESLRKDRGRKNHFSDCSAPIYHLFKILMNFQKMHGHTTVSSPVS